MIALYIYGVIALIVSGLIIIWAIRLERMAGADLEHEYFIISALGIFAGVFWLPIGVIGIYLWWCD